jgi:hypothetical protein
MDHIFLDSIHDGSECADLAVVRTDRKGKVIATYSEKLKTKSFMGVALADALLVMQDAILSPKFDENFMCVSHKPQRRVIREPFGESWITLSTLAWPLAFSGLIPSITLDSIAKHYGVTNKAPKTAQGNVVALHETYWQMMRRYKTALTAEDSLRGFGGDALEKLRRELGF